MSFFTNNFVTVPPCYYSESQKRFIFFTNGVLSDNQFLPQDTNQQSWAVHNWVLSVTNHLVYAFFDGNPVNGGASLLDYVNLGPFGFSTNLTQMAAIQGDGNNGGGGLGGLAGSSWNFGSAGDNLGPMYPGLINQVNAGTTSDSTYYGNLTGQAPNSPGWVFDADYNPSNAWNYPVTFVANDPMVHYTIGDLTWPGYSVIATPLNINGGAMILPMTNSALLSARYQPWGMPKGQVNDMLFKDPQLTSASAWQFPSNKYPSIGWLGRVHRGTPWQTVYFKSDDPTGGDQFPNSWLAWVNSIDTYPTNDWAIPDLFTTAPNDNAARGLLSVNQTNDAAWAAVLAGVMMPTNEGGSLQGVAIAPNNVYSFVDGPGGFNETRANEPNGVFHKLGYILKSPVLTVSNMFMANNAIPNFPYNDEVEERIPQQILGLLKVGEPQFVIYAWGESLRPKARYLGAPTQLTDIVTNYEITGEFLSRTVCHVVHTNTIPKMVIDSYNIVPSD